VSRAPKCEACSAELIWALTAEGKAAPICKEPSDDGNVLLFRSREDRSLQCRSFGGDTLVRLRDAGVPLRLNHFANCPDRERFAKQVA
jgi:hypothetical protein